MENILCERCIKSKDTVGKPTLILFSDGSEGDYGTHTYVQWNMTNGKFDCNLLAAKSILALRKTQKGGKIRKYKQIYTESDNLQIISDSKCSMYGAEKDTKFQSYAKESCFMYKK